MDFTIEMGLDQQVVARDGYTFLDLLSDIGGMQGMLISGVAYFMAMWNYNYFDDYMVQRLFRIKKVDADKHSDQTVWQNSSFARPGIL